MLRAPVSFKTKKVVIQPSANSIMYQTLVFKVLGVKHRQIISWLNNKIMKYAILLQVADRRYLLGFTNNEILPSELDENNSIKYTIKLKEMSSLFIRLEGDALVYLS